MYSLSYIFTRAGIQKEFKKFHHAYSISTYSYLKNSMREELELRCQTSSNPPTSDTPFTNSAITEPYMMTI